eukprot:201125-Chlamydomonas_euryale.AAC.1
MGDQGCSAGGQLGHVRDVVVAVWNHKAQGLCSFCTRYRSPRHTNLAMKDTTGCMRMASLRHAVRYGSLPRSSRDSWRGLPVRLGNTPAEVSSLEAADGLPRSPMKSSSSATLSCTPAWRYTATAWLLHVWLLQGGQQQRAGLIRGGSWMVGCDSAGCCRVDSSSVLG